MGQREKYTSTVSMNRIALGASTTLAAALAALTPVAAINGQLKGLLIVPESTADGRWNLGAAASASTPAITAAWFPFSAAQAATIRIFGTGYINVYQAI